MRRFYYPICVILITANVRAADAPPVIRSARSGSWSSAATWDGGTVPGAGARVLIREGHRVVYNDNSDTAIRAINIAGTLSFDPKRDTRLDVGLIKIQAGDQFSEDGFDCEAHLAEPKAGEVRPALEVGTPDEPIAVGHTARLRLIPVDGQNPESCPAIVCCGGRMEFHGASMSHAWVKLGTTAKKGNSTITLAEPVSGWRTGDRIIVTATQRDYRVKSPFTEERRIKSIDSARLTLDAPLAHEHLGDGEYRGEVANLSRNVVVESAEPAKSRGHTMYHRGSAGSISYAEFRHLGKEGVLGRYALHYHLCGDTMRGSSVVGASIWDSSNRWLTIHGTNYLVVRDCVGYGSIGHGFFLEDGTEVYNVLDRNLAVGARRGKPLPKQMLPFDHNEGAGFWWANSLNSFTRNVATENALYGYRFEATAGSSFSTNLRVLQPDGSRQTVDIRTLPFVRFDHNEVHSNVGLYGVNLGEGVNRVGPDTRHPFVVRDLKIWDVHYAFRPQVPSLLVEHLHIHRAAYGVYHPNFDNHVYRDVYIGKTETEPFNRGHDDDSIQHGMLTVDGLTFADIRSYAAMPLIQISDSNGSGRAATYLRNVKTPNWTGKQRALINRGGGPRPAPKTEHGVPIFVLDWFGPGRHAKVVSTKAPDLKSEALEFHAEAPLTGDESRVAEVANVEFPTLLTPVDDLPPATVITSGRKLDGGMLLVRGTTSDNGAVTRVVINGVAAKSLRDDFAEWEATIPAALKLQAHAEDAAGNVEKMPHVVTIR